MEISFIPETPLVVLEYIYHILVRLTYIEEHNGKRSKVRKPTEQLRENYWFRTLPDIESESIWNGIFYPVISSPPCKLVYKCG